jgi:hypothetical protein
VHNQSINQSINQGKSTMKHIVSHIAVAAVVAAAGYTSVASAVVSTCTPDFAIPTNPEPNGTFCPKDGYNSQSVVLRSGDNKLFAYKVKLTKIIPFIAADVGLFLINGSGGFAKGANGIQCPGAGDNTPPPNDAFGGNAVCNTLGTGATQPVKARVVYRHD